MIFLYEYVPVLNCCNNNNFHTIDTGECKIRDELYFKCWHSCYRQVYENKHYFLNDRQ